MNLAKIKTGVLDGNYHGPSGASLRLSWKLVRMQCYVKCWRLYLYRADGRAHWIEVTFPRWSGGWPA